MKIGIICYPTYGGSGVVATELGKNLASKGHEIHFICYAIPIKLNKFLANIYFHEVELYQYPLFEFPIYTDALASKIIDVARFNKLDIIHVHYAIPHATSAILAKMILNNKIKVITTLHGTDITLVGLEPSFTPVVRFGIEASDGVTAVSKYLRETTISTYNINREIEVIPNFVDTETFKPSKNPQLRKRIAPKDEKILIHVSNFRKVKRVQDAVKVFDLVRKKIPSKLVFVGDGPERSDAENLCRQLKLYDDVVFLGKQEALHEILCSADIFLLPSQMESFGLSALEAMSCGIPVIATNVGGIPEVVLHGETGYLTEVGNVERMASYVIELLEDENKYREFSEKARERAEKLFDKNLIIPKYEIFYEKILNQ
ncbi:N-acetyl-alpha-D-glucosaminyl L-malate synthase BshA [Candidatus Kryptobacter tengchongensis]|nr:N-acetyl-alpha-D-glucosaminyl L-malate synthase BshA [Candidatus Kryptobacter tengchongensis]CUU04876.1 N-acetyl-alpha-D-glucosaminyl L-malate synthase BshA [Candidatus Kryptobacter tengchongensis]